MMLYAHVYRDMATADHAFKLFINWNDSNMSKARPHVVYFKDGNEHWFMDCVYYRRWCIGRSYKLENRFGGWDSFHSGFPDIGGDSQCPR